MLSRKNKLLLLKLLSLFSIVRGYNVLMIVLAQYLAAIYIMAPDLPLREVVFDLRLFILVLASALVIAAGYIINSFYDSEKDLINKPRKSMLDRLVSQQTKLSTYFILNFLSVLFASYVSFKAVLFFAAYIFGIWLYSHKLKRLPLLGNLVSATLAITPFFAVFVYYRNFETVIFVHAIFLFLLILSREFIKDMENIAGDIALNYKTIPILFGTKYSKISITLLAGLSLLPAFLLIEIFDVGYMYLYFILAMALLIIFIFLLWRASTKKDYVWLHNILKFIIIAGVFSILLIDVDLVLNRIL
ncbi:MAG: geranylgeranylglycerol-phosphate geranylgeranyltransferase [Flavobacteriaceae bacterium]|nr:geranylgeranylglycerol-phosphate geranylgeranyltransferase [Muriicola sp.]MBT8289843.1 geranylgeranylglycerol-phosphate geranylgeranyltransferase [Muriicola sp.]NNK19763.1 geranylgeranylglycerol-phosphate geranylgeranyltransferase [Flavobacteriaceae bacterium]NNK35036.1 geranylgeranylglycerol-phosphate geranylgeranyltransferase [Eudoraea sp.]NNL40245.1 geranylgeranylglycerol-phosphate geranylgeranyltransferase [Flavobacteriaceae bacterium]